MKKKNPAFCGCLLLSERCFRSSDCLCVYRHMTPRYLDDFDGDFDYDEFDDDF